jgi:hypothetical protein
MSNRKVLALAVAATLSTQGVVAEQRINAEGTGDLLMFPFYSVENNSNTYLHISNTTNDNKAIVIRFMEHVSGATVLEFSAYLGPYDIFPVALASTEGSGGSVLTTDTTCTVPELGTSNAPYDGTQETLFNGKLLRTQPFVPYVYNSDVSSDISRTQRGYVEVIEMGVVSPDIDVSKCDDLRTLWNTGVWGTDPKSNVSPPTGGLSGSSMFINPSLAYSMAIDITAIDGWGKDGVVYHSLRGPVLTDGSTTADLGNLQVDYTGQVDGSVMATSALLATKSMMNEVVIEPAIAAETDWVVTFPTKKYLTNGTTAGAPFTEVYDGKVSTNVACETLSLSQFDRASNSSTSSGSFVPTSSSGIDGELCDTVTVLKFASDSALQVDDTIGVSFNYDAGAVRLVADQELPADNSGTVIKGLPVLGFAGTRIVNGDMSYGYAVSHVSNTVTSGG